MASSGFLARQFGDIRAGGWTVLQRKTGSAFRHLTRLVRLLPALPLVLLIRGLRPFVVVRIQPLVSDTIGHMAGNTEIYLCETKAGINVPAKPHWDICYFAHPIIANQQLARMWRRAIRIGPRWILAPVHEFNQWMPGGDVHTAGSFARHNRDIHNVLDRFEPHLSFTPEEEDRGQAELRSLGIPEGAPFVCLVARDSAYLATLRPGERFDYHSYRDVDIANFVAAADLLAARGYYVVRLGSVVKERIPSTHAKVIDYATSGKRTEFLDVYLGAKCFFCLTVGSGIDSIPMVFRRLLAFVDIIPICNYPTAVPRSLFLAKRHRDIATGRYLTLTETFSNGAAFCLYADCYAKHGVELEENTAHEIACVAEEMLARMTGEWVPHPDDERLQQRFWELYPMDTREATEGHPLHGGVRARHSAHFLRENEWWLQ